MYVLFALITIQSGIDLPAPVSQFIIPLLRGLLDRIDAFATPVTFPKWSDEAEKATTPAKLLKLLKTRKPLRHVLTSDFFMCVQAVEAKHLPTRYLASLGSPPSDEYTLQMENYAEDLLASVDQFVNDYLDAMGDDIEAEQRIVLEDLHNKVVWAYRSGFISAQDWCFQTTFPLLTPTIIKALSDGVLSLNSAITEVHCCVFGSARICD